MANLRGMGTRLSGSADDWTSSANGSNTLAKQSIPMLCSAVIGFFLRAIFQKKAVRQLVLNLSKLVRTCQKLVEHGVFQPQNLLKLVETCFFGPVRSFCVILHVHRLQSEKTLSFFYSFVTGHIEGHGTVCARNCDRFFYWRDSTWCARLLSGRYENTGNNEYQRKV